MNSMTRSAATLAAFGIVGVASDARAGLVTVDENIAPSTAGSSADIAVDSMTAQFYYDGIKTAPGHGCGMATHCDYGYYRFGTLGGGLLATSGINGSATIDANPADYVPEPSGLTMASNVGHKGATPPNLDGSGYVNLAFTDGEGVTEYGFAHFRFSNAALETITYETAPTASVPEPSTWALLIAGAGATGLAMRRRTRSALLAAA